MKDGTVDYLEVEGTRRYYRLLLISFETDNLLGKRKNFQGGAKIEKRCVICKCSM